MTPALRPSLLGIVVLGVALIGFVGCRRDSTPDSSPQAPVDKRRAEDDKVADALDLFRAGTDAGQFREALGMIGPTLSAADVQPRLRLQPAQRELLAQA